MVLGYIKFFKSLNIGYKNNDLRVYVHLLLNANISSATLPDEQKITKGQLVTSYPSIADKLGLTIKAVRVAIQHLVDDGLITCQGYKYKYCIVTISDYGLQTSDNTYNYTRLYRQVQANTWYADDVTARLYFYILLHLDADNTMTTQLTTLCTSLGVTTQRIYTALAKLTEDRAIKIDRNRQRIIISISAPRSTKQSTTTTPSTPHNPTTSTPSASPASPPSYNLYNDEDDWY